MTVVSVNSLIEYENGELSDVDTLCFFSELVKSGLAWQLQGHYGRTAKALIDDGYLTVPGELTEKAKDFMEAHRMTKEAKATINAAGDEFIDKVTATGPGVAAIVLAGDEDDNYISASGSGVIAVLVEGLVEAIIRAEGKDPNLVAGLTAGYLIKRVSEALNGK